MRGEIMEDVCRRSEVARQNGCHIERVIHKRQISIIYSLCMYHYKKSKAFI